MNALTHLLIDPQDMLLVSVTGHRDIVALSCGYAVAPGPSVAIEIIYDAAHQKPTEPYLVHHATLTRTMFDPRHVKRVKPYILTIATEKP